MFGAGHLVRLCVCQQPLHFQHLLLIITFLIANHRAASRDDFRNANNATLNELLHKARRSLPTFRYIG